jgi:hypothetical protein
MGAGHSSGCNRRGHIIHLGSFLCAPTSRQFEELGLTVLLFVVLGNPSAGGAYQSKLFPTQADHLESSSPTVHAPPRCETAEFAVMAPRAPSGRSDARPSCSPRITVFAANMHVGRPTTRRVTLVTC